METERIRISSQKSEAKLTKRIHKRLVKSNLDIILLAELRTKALSGYDAISFIQSKYGYLISSGTVYSLFYALERDGFVEGFWDERKRVYKLTEKGKESIETILQANNQISVLAKSLLSIS